MLLSRSSISQKIKISHWCFLLTIKRQTIFVPLTTSLGLCLLLLASEGTRAHEYTLYSAHNSLELLLEVVVKHGVQDGVGHGGGHPDQVAEQVGEHHVLWGEINVEQMKCRYYSYYVRLLTQLVIHTWIRVKINDFCCDAQETEWKPTWNQEKCQYMQVRWGLRYTSSRRTETSWVVLWLFFSAFSSEFDSTFFCPNNMNVIFKRTNN